jgi:putative intracellular protease/amidase
VVFATEGGGRAAAADPLLLRDGWFFGALGAAPEPRRFYRELEAAREFRQPIGWNGIVPGEFDALLLPGGHAPGMMQYLASERIHEAIARFWSLGRPVAAICHGVVALARSRLPSGLSVLSGRRTTCLPKYMEQSAYWLTAWRLGRHYRTYPEYVQDEVRRALGATGTFEEGPRVLTRRGTELDDRPAFVVEDGHYLSARWPGDAYLFSRRLVAALDG